MSADLESQTLLHEAGPVEACQGAPFWFCFIPCFAIVLLTATGIYMLYLTGNLYILIPLFAVVLPIVALLWIILCIACAVAVKK